MGYSSVLSLIKELILTELSHSSIIIFAMSVVFFAMFVKTVTGFGSAIICAPLFAFFLSPQATVTIIIVNSVMQGVIMVIRLKKYIRFTSIIWLLLFGTIGRPMGVLVLMILPVTTLKVMTGLVIVTSSIALASGKTIKIKRKRFAQSVAGLCSGLLGGSTSVSGPPVILFLQNWGLKKNDFRGTTTGFFLITDFVQCVFLAMAGMFTPQVIRISVAVIPAIIVGFVLGELVQSYINEDLFKKIVIIFLGFTGTYLVIRQFL